MKMYRARVGHSATHRDEWQGENGDTTGQWLMGRDKGSHGHSTRFTEHPERGLNRTLSNHPWHEGKYADD